MELTLTSKVFQSADQALEGLCLDGMTVMAGGFGLAGSPEKLIQALRRNGVKNLTVISNNCGADEQGLWHLLNNGQIGKMIASYVGDNKLLERLYLSGEIEVELNPQGTLAERIRAGGAGIAAFYTKTGVGTVVAEGKHTETFEGDTYLRENWLRADLAIIKAWRGDHEGNLVYRKTARNFNPPMATAARVVVAEVEELLPDGSLDPDHIHTPGIYVSRIFQGINYEKRVEQRMVRARSEDGR